MKKKIIIILALLATLNVNAETKYTDYEYVGYSDTKEESELLKYEEVTLNKFYKEKRVNEIYAPIDRIIEDSPYVDLEDYQESTRIVSKDDVSDGNYRLFNVIKDRGDNYKTQDLYLNNIKNYKTNPIYEIEIYDKEEKLSYRVDGPFPWLNDGILLDGGKLPRSSIILTLDRECYLDDLKIVFYYKHNVGTELSFRLVTSGATTKRLNEEITLTDKKTIDDAMTISIKSYEDFKNIVSEYNESELVELDNLTKTYIYELNDREYMHYDIEREYFDVSELDYMDGYIFDPNESIQTYKVYKREIIEEDNSTDNSDVEFIDNTKDDNSDLENENKFEQETPVIDESEEGEVKEINKQEENLTLQPNVKEENEKLIEDVQDNHSTDILENEKDSEKNITPSKKVINNLSKKDENKVLESSSITKQENDSESDSVYQTYKVIPVNNKNNEDNIMDDAKTEIKDIKKDSKKIRNRIVLVSIFTVILLLTLHLLNTKFTNKNKR